jgi:hexokinase
VSYFISNKVPLADLFTTKKDKDIAAGIINDMLERGAVFVAGNIAAVILKTGKGKTPADKVLIVADGSTFFKFSDYNKKVEKHLKKCFALLKETRYYDIIDGQIDDINLKGAAIAAAENV